MSNPLLGQLPLPGRQTTLLDRLSRLRRIRRDILGYIGSVIADFGDVSYFEFGQLRSYMVAHPDLIHEMLVTQADTFHRDRRSTRLLSRVLGRGLLVTDGDIWRRQRKLMQPAFYHKHVVSYGAVMQDAIDAHLAKWAGGQTRDVTGDMMALTLAIVADSLFGADTEDVTERVATAVDDIQAAITALSLLFFPVPAWLPLRANRQLRRAQAAMDEIIYPIIRRRRASGEERPDLLGMLISAADEGDGQGMTDKEIRDEVLTLFLAGHETTANALSWTWYLLGRHPEVEARLHGELDQVLKGRPASVDDLARLPYTEMVVKEAMRLYPPGWIISRMPIRDTALGGYHIYANSSIIVSVYHLHRDSRFFPDPARFDPERFRPERAATIPKYAYLPFGLGPHVCIGNAFALMEARLILATFAQHYRVRVAPGFTAVPEPLVTLRLRDGLPVILEARKSAATRAPQRQTAAAPS